jgi:prepilin-type N-terminal cleavage/methylation domain-containing protein
MKLSPQPTRNSSGYTLVEVLVASGIGGLVLAAIMAVTLFSARSFAALVNYVDLDNYSRNALDEMTSEIRQADRLMAGSPTAMTFQFSNPTNNTSPSWTVSYVYNPDARTLSRIQAGNRKVLLEECDFLDFQFFKRNPATNSFDLYATAAPPIIDPDLCKAVQMRWVCSRTIMQQAVNTESVQSARVIIRKK